MSEKCDNKKTCGCNDGPIGSPLPCDPCECTGLECAEQFCSECIVSCEEPTVLPLGSGDGIFMLPGDSIYKTLQKMMAEVTTLGCGERCAYSLKKMEVTDASITLKWFGVDAETYNLKYWNIATPAVITTVGVTGSGQHILLNLKTDTTYRMQLTTTDGVCKSPIIEIKTN